MIRGAFETRSEGGRGISGARRGLVRRAVLHIVISRDARGVPSVSLSGAGEGAPGHAAPGFIKRGTPLLPGWLGFILPTMAVFSPDELDVVVTDCGDGTWEWEICRQGEPLAARMRDGPFKSHDVAVKAGEIALREFFELLEFAQQDDA